MGWGLFGKKSDATTDTFSRIITHEDAVRIRDVWTEYCAADGLEIPKKAIAELNKRIKGTKPNVGGKAKFNFHNTGLDDKHVKYLLRVLALAPCTDKLDLSGNAISNKSAEVLVKLLKGQINLVKTVDVDARRDATFLSDVKLSGSSQPIRDETQAEILRLTNLLKWGNAEAHIRKLYWSIGAPEEITKKTLTLVCNKG